jgi:nucleoside-diphosphate-sugar epimerase
MVGEVEVKVLVTGATGFLGGHLVENLWTRGDEVRVLVRPGKGAEWLRDQERIEISEGDVKEISSLAQAMQGIQKVYHLAARTGSWGKEEEYYTTNIDGLANVICAALSAGVERIVHTSSVSVYGQRISGLITEDAPFFAENDPCSRSKIIGEKLIANLIRDCHAPVVIVRPGWVYGARDIVGFGRLAALIERGKGYLIGSGKNLLPLVHVQDVVQALIKAGDADECTIGRAYTIINDQRITQAEYLHAIADALGVERVRRRLPGMALYTTARLRERIWRARKHQQAMPARLSSYDIAQWGGNYQFTSERAREELGYQPEIDLVRGIRESVIWYKEYASGKPSHIVIEESARAQNTGGSQKEVCV